MRTFSQKNPNQNPHTQNPQQNKIQPSLNLIEATWRLQQWRCDCHWYELAATTAATSNVDPSSNLKETAIPCHLSLLCNIIIQAEYVFFCIPIQGQEAHSSWK